MKSTAAAPAKNAPVDLVITEVQPYGRDATDIWIAAGTITAMPPAGGRVPAGVQVIVGTGLIALPGLVDLHTHLREPGGEDAETIATGTRAAAAGGYTDVFAMANTNPVTDTPDRVERISTIGARHGSARVHPVGAVTIGLAGERLAPLEDLAAAGVTLFSDDGKCVDDPRLIREALTRVAALDVAVAEHAQDGRLAGLGQINAGAVSKSTGLPPWPSVAEETIIARDAILSAEAGAPLHICHLSTAGSVAIIRWAKAQGWPVTAEVTPHHLLLTHELAALADPRFKVNPPLRSDADVQALREALADGTIDIIATDHAPHPAQRKALPWREAPFGMTGLETALPVAAHVLAETGALDWGFVARIMSQNAAHIGRIDDRAGRPVAVGEPATLTLVDPSHDWTVTDVDRFSKSGNSPFLGRVFRHRIALTMIEGRITHRYHGDTSPADAPVTL